MTFTAEHYWQRVRRDHLNRGLVQANRHIAEGRLYVAKQTALIDGLDRDGHDSAMARELLAILHKSLQMHEGHREHIIRELELGRKLPVARGWHLFTTRYPSQRLSASLAHFDIIFESYQRFGQRLTAIDDERLPGDITNLIRPDEGAQLF